MNIGSMQVHTFVAELAGKAPVPGGGGASAAVAAIGMALGHMVGSLTQGKQKYAAVQADILALNEQAAQLEQALLALADRDADVFAPLSRAYGLPTDTEEQRAHKADVMEDALYTACGVPLDIMRTCCAAIDLVAGYAEKGAAIAISDAGVGATLLQSALQGASLNVFINTKSMRDRARAAAINAEATHMLDVYVQKAGTIFEDVKQRLEA